MKICHISLEYPPETGWGGIGTYTYNISHALAELGHEVHVITQAVKLEHDYLDEKVIVHRIRKRYLPIPLIRDPLTFFAHSYKIYRWFRKSGFEFDVIEVPEWRAEGVINSLISNTPIITRLHTPLFMVNRLSCKQETPADKIVNFLERTQTINSVGITSPTEALKREVVAAWGVDASRITVIPNGINVKRIRSAKIKHDLQGLDYLVYVGRLEPRKGVHVLAKALPGIFERFPNLKMVFVGNDMPYGKGTMKELILSINSKCIHNIIFTGFVTEERKFSLIKNSKFVVLPSLWENFPYTCLESMALAKAVIATKNCGFEEIIEDTQSGFLVKGGDYKALQNQIVSCLEAEDRIRSIESTAKRRVQDFDIMKVSEDFVRYYETVLNAYK
jgi:glycosyltransferase involved in cell wall biosynthesis